MYRTFQAIYGNVSILFILGPNRKCVRLGLLSGYRLDAQKMYRVIIKGKIKWYICK